MAIYKVIGKDGVDYNGTILKKGDEVDLAEEDAFTITHLEAKNIKLLSDIAPKLKPETVEVDRTMLEGILKEVGELRKTVEKVDQLEKDNIMLLAVADKSRLATYQSRQPGATLIRTARVWMWNNKIVKATVTIRNEAFTDNFGRVHTDQVLNVIMADGKEEEVAYDRFSKEKDLIDAEIISRRTNDETGQTFYKLRMKDGEEIEINPLFLN